LRVITFHMEGDNTILNEIKIKSIIPCEYMYTFDKLLGIQPANTCVGVSRELVSFDFPSRPKNIYFLALTQIAKSKYRFIGRIVDKDGTQLAITALGEKEIPDEIPDDFQISLNLVFIFKDVIFPIDGLYFFQLIINDIIIYNYDFPVLKAQRPEYSPDKIKCILDDPETIKHSSVELKCNCGKVKTFSLSLDPGEQKEGEKLPEGDIYVCDDCEQKHNLVDIKSNLKFYLGTKNIVDSINRNLSESRVLARCGFFNYALVIQVSAFEAFMRDSFISRYNSWFMHLLENQSNAQIAKKEIIKIVKELKLKDEFYEQLIVLGKGEFSSPKEEIIYHNNILKTLLFGETEDSQHAMNRISFQQLKGTLGGFWAYKKFFGFDIKSELDKQKNKYNEDLQEYFTLRHKIIHASTKFNMNKYEVTSEMLQKNQEIILFIRNLMNEKLLKIKKDHET